MNGIAYHPCLGQLVYTKPGSNRRVGKVVGWVGRKGYRETEVNGIAKKVHRLIYEIHYGPIPPGMQIDHINGNRDDNRIDNLRLATQEQNQANMKLKVTNTSGVKGVCWNQRYGMWYARVGHNNERHTSLHNTFFAATLWVRMIREQLHGEFVNHG